MKRLKALLQDDMMIAVLAFVVTWAAVAAAVAIPLSPMFN